MEKQKFKIGDRVRFKSWARMAKEYGGDESNCIGLPNSISFVSKMKHLCGTYATISEITTDEYGNDRCLLTNFTTNGDTDWAYSPEMLVRARTRKKKELPLGFEYETDDEQKEKPKANYKYKIGDRVRAIKPVGDDGKIGVCGTVIGFAYPDITVEFDDDINGHTGSLCGKAGKDGYCWHCKKEGIELIDFSKKKRGRPIGSKNKKKVELEPEKWAGDKIKDKVKEHIPELDSNSFRTYKEVPESGHLVELNEEILKTLYNINGLLEKLVDIQTNKKQFDVVEWFKDMLAKD